MEELTGGHAVEAALRAGRRRLHRLRVRAGLQPSDRQRRLLDLAASMDLPRVEQAEARGDRGEPIVLEADRIPEFGLEELLASGAGEADVLDGAEKQRSPWWVALDGVEDPQNLGATARVADAFGCQGLLLTRRHAPPLSPTVSRASAGAIEHLPVARVPNLVRALGQLRDHGFWSIGADLEGATPLYESDAPIWEGPLVFVMGAEGRGLRKGVREATDYRVQIPMVGQVESLNVGSAAAVLLYEALRRRNLREPA